MINMIAVICSDKETAHKVADSVIELQDKEEVGIKAGALIRKNTAGTVDLVAYKDPSRFGRAIIMKLFLGQI